jgi:hypothetical protein
MTHTKDEALKLAAEFDKRFTSMNGVDVPERVSVPRDEWRALHGAIKQALAQPAPTVQPVAEARFDGTLHWLEPYGIGLHRFQGPLYTTPPAAQQEPVQPVQPVAAPKEYTMGNWFNDLENPHGNR